LTGYPIQQIPRRPEISVRLAKWAIELGDFDLKYKPRTSLKWQVIADFLAEIPEGKKQEVQQDLAPKEREKSDELAWILHIDGASNVESSSASLILVSPEGVELTYALWCNFKTSNHETEYEALLAGLCLVQDLKAKNIKAHVDSLLVANQVSGNYDTKDPSMATYLQKTKELMELFNSCEVVYVPRSQNKKSDALSNLASIGFSHLAKEVRVHEVQASSIQDPEVNFASSLLWLPGWRS
jgi:ribonuclease HI